MEILGEAIGLDASEREAWLAAVCAGDDELRGEVARLLAHQKTATNFMEEPPLGGLARRRAEDESIVGRHVGPYLVVEEIGRGGMGAVYLARRADEQYESRVAVKVIKRGMDTDAVVRRFRNERQILATLGHPNVARLLDGGTTEDGRPYFVMEYVEGRPLTEYCDAKKLSVEERLRLFLKVCSAVSSAHRNLVVHRDIKPGNILVSEDGEPKLLDFGIAKLLDADAEGTATATLLRAMTPEYASPEQVKGEPVTTATDVYSLGVLLYELLTGVLPYKLKHRTADEITRAICEQEPTRPSTRVAQSVPRVEESGEASEAGVRARTAIRNPKLLRGDLDNIALMALRKEPQLRYASVEQFAEDIDLHLEGLPVRASRGTFTYRASKFVRRNKTAVAASALVLLTLVGGVVVSAWEAHAARVERAIAEERFNEVREMAHAVMFDYHDAIATLPGSTPVRERMVKDSLNYLDKLAQQAGDDRALLREIASAYLKVGDVQGRAFYANLGDTRGALESYQKALAIRQELTALEPNDAGLRGELAMSYERIGRLNTVLGNPAVAVEDLQKAMTIYEELFRADPANRPVRGELGLVNMSLGIAVGFSATNSLGDTGAGMEYQRKAIAILEPLVAEEPTNLTYREYLSGADLFTASLYIDSGNQPEALDYFRKALSIDQSLTRENPTNNYLQRELAVDYSNICNVLRNVGDNAGSLENGRQALAIFERMSAADPDDANIAKDLAIMHQNIGVSLTKAKDYAGASEHYRTSVRILEELAAKNPTDAELQMRKEWGYYRLSDVQSLSGDVARAIENAQHARSVLEALVAANARNSTAAKYLAVVYTQLGKCHALLAVASGTTSNQRTNHWREARDFYQKSLDIYQDMKSKGTLSGADAGKPDEAAREIARCDAALR
jgi:non-specific serine/threonine protein kinase/serine/threonine-protein kinase